MAINKAIIEKLNNIPLPEIFNEMYHIKWEEGRNFKRPWGNTATGRTPSCRYYPQTNSVGDFGTHKGGGPINFVMLMDECSFNDACRKLMKFRNIEELPDFSYKSYLARLEKNKNSYYKKIRLELISNLYENLELNSENLLKISVLFCEQNLLDQGEFMDRALSISKVSLEEFMSNSVEGFGELLTDNLNITKQVAKNTDTLFQMQRQFSSVESFSGVLNDTLVDRWKEEAGRYIFPVFLPGKLVVGFSGRSLTPHIVKYLTRFDFGLEKDDILYGLDLAIPAIKELGYVIVVEGILDVLRCRSIGFYNVVAPLSTSLSENHVIILKPFTDKFLLTYDGDEGGQAATSVAMRNLDKYRLQYESVEIPEGEDPDSYGLKDAEGLKKLLSFKW